MNTMRKQSQGRELAESGFVRCVSAMLILLACLFIPQPSLAAVKAPKMHCHAYVVMDAGSGEVLFGQDEDKVIYPASTAKLMTAIVCVENGDVNSKIKTSYDVLGSVTPGTFCLGLNSGKKFTFKDLLSLSLISSAADATDSLAAGVFGSKEACVEAMNAKCRELGLTQTSFDNPVGSDIGAGLNNTYATAREMALITRYAMANPLIRKTVAKSHYETRSGQEIYANSTNWFIRGMFPYNKKRYKIIGSKSGTTNAAGHVFIATAIDDEGHEVICAYFGDISKESTFAGIRKLLNYTFKQYDKGKLALTGNSLDVRASGMRELFDTYASLHVYPYGLDGRFYPNYPIRREQLAPLLKGIDSSDAYQALPYIIDAFAGSNKKGNVTAAKAASLVQELYPSHISDEETASILEGCTNTDILDEKEKEAFAIFVKSGLLPDDNCKNAKQLLTRKEALILADHLADYQVGYKARNGAFSGLLTPEATYKESPAGESSTAVDASSQADNTTATADASSQAEATATADADTSQEQPTENTISVIDGLAPAPLMMWNTKWKKHYEGIAAAWQAEEAARIAAEEAAAAEASTGAAADTGAAAPAAGTAPEPAPADPNADTAAPQ